MARDPWTSSTCAVRLRSSRPSTPKSRAPTPELKLYRVFPWRPGSDRRQPGHPLYVPAKQGAGRIDNPEHYRSLYASESPAGAVAEAFGNHSIWTEALLEGPPVLPGSRRALVTYRARVTVLDLDDPRELLQRQLRPSRVVIRDLGITQAWALRIFRERLWDGVRWWSRHDARWGALGLWRQEGLAVERLEPLTADHPALLGAREALARAWQPTGHPSTSSTSAGHWTGGL